ncbi:hypothetical protein [Curtobacterium sp. MCSS17_016]|uniref:hypothetical protein n=1 Tax=Curtobacterium sp. MCSS17_016 TaxID=2175644 RepID=UPI000DA8166C|nr:hypothetical protein [Curtobacterium sp. MCSS17_016]WIE81505.1 hypothetical protein DEJ19_019910 [Curtobacterium sp. MCSS17_016]
MSTPAQKTQPRHASGQYTFARHDPAVSGLLSREDATEEAREVFADAQERATRATAHARRAGVNLLAALATSQDPRAATLALQWTDGRYQAADIRDRAGDVIWDADADTGNPINRTVAEIGAYIDEPGDATDSGVRVLTGGRAELPLTPSARFTLGDVDRLLG